MNILYKGIFLSMVFYFPLLLSASEKLNENLNGLHDEAKFWGAIINTTRQMEKVDEAREELEKSIPKGESKKYDLVVKGTDFVGFQESSKPHLRHGDSKTVGVVEIIGKGPTRKEQAAREQAAREQAAREQAAREQAARDQAQLEREYIDRTGRHKGEIKKFKEEGGNYRAPF